MSLERQIISPDNAVEGPALYNPEQATFVPDRTLSVAPMMEWTDCHARYFLRLLAPRTLLFTEMVPALAVWHNDPTRFLAYSPEEHPLAVQFGGADPEHLAHCARLAEAWGYDEVNLNVGCPSDRVQAGAFGACLMAEPDRVADCVAAMRESCRLPVTVKHRIGVDDLDNYDFLAGFVERVAAAGCQTFYVHARKAWLKGLSPKENREIPPLDYARVHRLKRDFPQLEVVLNGGITALEEIETALQEGLDGVMVGREAYGNPWALAGWDRALYGAAGAGVPDRHAAVRAFLPYVEAQLAAGARLQHLARHILGLFNGCPGGRRWRRHISEQAHKDGAGPEVIEQALALVPEGRAVA
ncbi:tRNA-U16,U17-dihydrouridine synthase [Alkalispirillum mobile]|uniref:tRNA-dihydrouridine(20/20a) synthase n=1 Tax=Alkalispirillum mobile TaxID=85925 RepID=A0A498C634_9GAMM|nr:tRNA dihydrouridine(20/20a) synthase DusA [Alkalispirillum mobile]RLK50509.1 tRNA-U16,U17-dihydrouridine synthase [Alkalispirillum mobile]